MRAISSTRTTSAVVAVAAVVLAVLGLVPTAAHAASLKTGICHRTHSITNPYRYISVSNNAVSNNNGHLGHTGGLFGSSTPWGDIIPSTGNGSKTLNDSTAGLAVLAGTTKLPNGKPECRYMSIGEYVSSETAAGRQLSDIVADLNDQAANEDAAALKAAGGKFTVDNIYTVIDEISAAISAASNVTATSATLNGSLKTGSTPATTSFVYGTDPGLVTGTTSVGAVPGSVTGSASLTAAVTGLTGGTTYYVKVVGITNPGTATEGSIESAIRTFTTTGTTAQAITFPQPSDMTYGSESQTLAAEASSGLAVSFSTTTPSICTVGGSAVTQVGAGTCTIVASQPGDTTYAPAADVSQSVSMKPAPQTITFPALTDITLGNGASALAATATSGLDVSYGTATSTVCTISNSAITVLTTGTCTITADQAGNDVWLAAEQVTRSFNIAAAPVVGLKTQQIIFSALGDITWGESAPTLTASTDSKLAVEFTSNSSTVCSITNGAVTVLNVGTCTLVASQPGNSEYAAAVSVQQSFDIAQAPQATTFGALSPITYGDAVPSLGASVSSNLTIDYTAGPSSVCAMVDGKLTLAGPGDCEITAFQPGDDRFFAARAVTQHLVVSTVPVPVTPKPPITSPSQPTSPATSNDVPPPGVPIVAERIAGQERQATSIALAQQLYPAPQSAKAVVIARDDIYADGLTGSPFAGSVDAPVLLTDPAALSVSTMASVARLVGSGGTVYILGREAAIHPYVADQLSAAGYHVVRIGGADRYETASLIATRMAATGTVKRVYVATGINFPDALAAANAAGVADGVVLLTKGATMPTTTGVWLQQHAKLQVSAIGGSAATATPTAAPIVGADRYSTAALVVKQVLPKADGLVMVTGADFPDGLAGAAFANKKVWPMLLVNP
ncbi:MAG: cell wall-binding repeat-containing protein, partial [Actinomycetes bacterium]